MSALALHEFMTRELMRLTAVSRCFCIRDYDITREQHVFRWFGGGKTVGMRLPVEAQLKDAVQYAELARKAWQETPAGDDSDEEYQRLEREATSSAFPWMKVLA